MPRLYSPFTIPKKFGVIDKFAWLVLYGKGKEEFTADDYVEYLDRIRCLAKKCSMTPRQVDSIMEIGNNGKENTINNAESLDHPLGELF